MTNPGTLTTPSALTTSIPSPTLSLNFSDIAGKRASQAASPTPAARARHSPPPLGAPTTATRTLRDVAIEMRAKVMGFLEGESSDELVNRVKAQVRVSMQVIEEALARYGPGQLALSYNGGKDCLVLLVLLLACLPEWESAAIVSSSSTLASNRVPNGVSASRPDTASTTPQPAIPSSLQALYVISTNPFPEVQSFVATTAHEYRLDLASFSDGMRAALADYLVERPGLRAVFVGTRRTDPHGANLGHFDPTDESWPACMRVHPVIDWHYVEIWAFIHALEIPFCKLYEMGYTSLGGMADTKPNPALAIDESGTEFKPAYALTDDDDERLGRFSPPATERRASRTATPGTPHQQQHQQPTA